MTVLLFCSGKWKVIVCKSQQHRRSSFRSLLKLAFHLAADCMARVFASMGLKVDVAEKEESVN
jgi:hypothetical protein